MITFKVAEVVLDHQQEMARVIDLRFLRKILEAIIIDIHLILSQVTDQLPLTNITTSSKAWLESWVHVTSEEDLVSLIYC